MQITLYNTRSRQKEPLLPIEPGKVSLYCCGPTVYNFAHLGNLRTYIFEDLLRRTLEYFGFEVRHVMNVTDVGHLSGDGDDGEDKMIASARQKGMTVWDIAAMFTDAFFMDSQRLNIKKPMVVCRATEHIQEMIDLIALLETRGFTYIADGNVYFDVSKFGSYGAMALLDRQELKAGARVLVDQAKKNPQDFVLWFTNSKFSQQAMIWDSPWGRGYPGWHIECSAMSRKYLGDHFDIHCGGVDHIPVHHTNEIAQTEAATGTSPWVNVWMHAEFLLMNKEKMAKSGSFSTLQSMVEKDYDPLDYRFFCLQATYRTQLNFSDDAMQAAKIGRKSLIEKIVALLGEPGKFTPSSLPNTRSALGAQELSLLVDFEDAIADDLNLPRAMAALNKVLKDQSLDSRAKLGLINVMDGVLGLDLVASAEKHKSQVGDTSRDPEAQEIDALVQARTQARKDKNFSEGDRIRDLLASRGIQIMDSPQGTTWRRV